MAIIKQFHASNGAMIYVDDSAIAGVSKDEMQRRKQLVLDTAREIAINIEVRRIKAEREAAEASEKVAAD